MCDKLNNNKQTYNSKFKLIVLMNFTIYFYVLFDLFKHESMSCLSHKGNVKTT